MTYQVVPFFLSKLPIYSVKSNFMISRFKLQQIGVEIHENIQIQKTNSRLTPEQESQSRCRRCVGVSMTIAANEAVVSNFTVHLLLCPDSESIFHLFNFSDSFSDAQAAL